MNRKRLQILRRALISYNERRGNLKFHLAQWAWLPEKYCGHDAALAVRDALDGKNYCGTTACACGLAAMLPSFQRDGLHLARNKHIQSTNYPITIEYQGRQNGEAAKRFFGISHATLMYLFVVSEYSERQAKNPLAVAKRIERVLERGEQSDYYS